MKDRELKLNNTNDKQIVHIEIHKYHHATLYALVPQFVVRVNWTIKIVTLGISVQQLYRCSRRLIPRKWFFRAGCLCCCDWC